MLSSISEIQKTIDINSDFSFVDRLGSFINNREMHLGYEDFKNGQKTSGSFIWESLSAIGNEIGNTIYTNIRDYIDLVSNIDRCKCNNLHSMFKMYGETYSLLGNYNNYPLEIRNLIDIFSINKKYLLKNNFIKEDFKQDLISNGVISGDEYCEYDSNNENVHINAMILDDEKYSDYIQNTFTTLLRDFLNLKYNDINQTPVLKSITNADLGEFELSSFQYVKTSDIENFKRMYSIPSSFDEQKIVDDIDNGLDFIDNYVGFQQELLHMEIDRRGKTLQGVDGSKLVDRNNKSVELKTRYSYYRKTKVLEYYNFLNNFFNQTNNISGIHYYDYNQKYFELSDDPPINGKPLKINNNGEYEINEDIINLAAKQLTNITLYICSLREKIKLQTRKNFMKGTTNLLKYLINQYIVDYSKISPIFNETSLSGLKHTMQNHSIDNVDIIEYIDQTEYFNIGTDTDNKSLNGNLTNSRYWEGKNRQETGEFTEDEIRKFYLRDLGLSSDSQISNINEFLDIIFNLGANSSYIDKNTGMYVTKLSSNGDVYSDIVYNQLSTLQYHWNKVCEAISINDQFNYPDDITISAQISNIIHDYVPSNLSAVKLSGIENMYDEQLLGINDISSKVDELSQTFNNIISSDYPYYFHDFTPTSHLLEDKLTQLSDIVTDSDWGYSTLNNEIARIRELLSQIKTKYDTYSSQLSDYGYTKVEYVSVIDAIQDAITFIDTYIQKDSIESSKISDLSNKRADFVKITVDFENLFSEYNTMIVDEFNSIFLVDCSYDSSILNDIQLNNITDYISQKTEIDAIDIENKLTDIKKTISNYNNDITIIEKTLIKNISGYTPTNIGNIETKIIYITDKIKDDIYTRKIRSNNEITAYLDELYTHMEFISCQVSSELSTTSKLSDVVETKLDELNYQTYPEYQSSRDNFILYNGISSNSDIYYNYKNITHPSKQYHPYLMNLVDAKTVIDDYSKLFNSYTIEKLNEENIQSYIDQYIGNFGQSVNIWKNNTIDYSGYTTTYEQSTHTYKKYGNEFSKIVDYDGAFYPEAVDFLRKYGIDTCISAIDDGKNGDTYKNLDEKIKQLKVETNEVYKSQLSVEIQNLQKSYDILSSFYQYYKPLNLTNEELEEEKTKLRIFSDVIIQMTNDYRRNEVYDIYKYGVDIYGNTYTLYKRYTKDDNRFYSENEITYKIKKNTTGKLWVRKFARPFAFPAFSRDGNIEIKQEYTSFIDSISGEEYNDTQGLIYDFEFSPNKQRIAFIVENTSDSSLKLYETANTFISQIEYEKIKNIETIRVSDASVNNNWQTFERQLGSTYADKMKFSDSNIFNAYVLVNVFPSDTNNFIGVYAIKKFENNDSKIIKSLNNITKIKVLDYNNLRISECDINTLNSATDDIVTTLFDKGMIAIAVNIASPLIDSKNTMVTYTANGLPCDNTDGYVITDNTHQEMNSHDVFTSDIVLYKYFIVYGNSQTPGIMKLIETNTFNTNADISYVPIYPSEQFRVDIQKLDISSDSYYSIELLGNSKNIDDVIDRVNPTPNPYFSINDISSNYIFGRVYEDYCVDMDKTLQTIENPSIHNNTSDKSVEYNEDEKCFYWTIDISEKFKDVYTDRDFKTLRLLVYNKSTFGKNPYFMFDISMIENVELEAEYNDYDDSHEVVFDNNIFVTGTYNNKNVNSIESNRIHNISSITAKLENVNGTRRLIFKFNVEDDSIVDTTFIEPGQINVCLLNDRDLTMFSYYHYLDAYGLYISADSHGTSQYAKKIDDVFGDTYDIKYSGQGIDSTFQNGIWNYYMDSYGTKSYLRNIDLANYNNLSDVEVLNDYKKAVFKYDEELHFDISSSNYFYPTMSLKYPKTYGMYVNNNCTFVKVDDLNLKNVFDDNELFILDIPNHDEILSEIGNIKIPLATYNHDFILVAEEFFDDSVPKYTTDDARILEYTIHEEETSQMLSDIGLEDIRNKQIYDIENAVSSMISPDDAIINDSIIVDVSASHIDIKKLLRMYINYKKDIDTSKITLYFNYFNYINTPFIKVEDSKIYSEIIEGTYAKIAPGESEKLDIVVQLRYMENGKIIGYKTVKLLTYQIFNISDDKPKFVIREVYRISKNDSILSDVKKYEIICQNNTLMLENNSDNTKFQKRVYWISENKVKRVSFNMIYDPILFECEGDTVSNVSYENKSNACVTVTIENPTTNNVDIPFKCKLTNSEMLSNEKSEFILRDIKFILDDSTEIVFPEQVVGITYISNIQL